MSRLPRTLAPAIFDTPETTYTDGGNISVTNSMRQAPRKRKTRRKGSAVEHEDMRKESHQTVRHLLSNASFYRNLIVFQMQADLTANGFIPAVNLSGRVAQYHPPTFDATWPFFND